MARTALEATAKNKAITSWPLNEKIKQLAAQNMITEQLAEEANEIRLLGNDMAHGDPDIPVSEKDVSDILGFLDTVLDYVYQQLVACKRARTLGKSVSRPKNDNGLISSSTTVIMNQ